MAALAEGSLRATAEAAELATTAALVNTIYEQSMQYWDRDPTQNRLEQVGVVRTKLEELEDHPLAELGYGLQVKYEGAQRVGAYKVRGATAAILAAQDRGDKFTRAVTASAGNLGQGLHFAAKQAGLECTLIMAANTVSPYKKNKMTEAGAIVNSCYPTLEAALAVAEELGEQPNNLLVHPFDSIDTMSGQASVAQELVEDLLIQQFEGKIDLHRDSITIVIPGGGGGLGAATAAVIAKFREHGLMGKNVHVVVAQMAGCNQIARLRSGRTPLTAEKLDVSCDGTAVLEPGKLAMKILMDPEYVSGVVSVPKAVLAKTMRYLSGLHGTHVEPAGALSMAAAMFMAEQQGHAPNDNRQYVFVTVTSGINISPQAFADFHPDTMTPEERDALAKTEGERTPKPNATPVGGVVAVAPITAPRPSAKSKQTPAPSGEKPSASRATEAKKPARVRRKTARAAGSTATGQAARVKTTQQPTTRRKKKPATEAARPTTSTQTETPVAPLVRTTASTSVSTAAAPAPHSQTETDWVTVGPNEPREERPVKNRLLSAPTAGYRRGLYGSHGQRYQAGDEEPKQEPKRAPS